MIEEERLTLALSSIYDLLGVHTESDAGAEIARLHQLEQGLWRPISTAPTKQRVLICGGMIRQPTIGERDPYRYFSEPDPNGWYWYLETSRGTGNVWPPPTHWMPLAEAPWKD